MTEETQPYQPIAAPAQPAAPQPPPPAAQPAPVAPPLPPAPPAPPAAAATTQQAAQPVAWTPFVPAQDPAAPVERPLAPAGASPTSPTAPSQRPARAGVGRGALVTAVLATAVLSTTGTYLAVSAANSHPAQHDAAVVAFPGGTPQATQPAGGTPATPAPTTAAPVTGDGSVVDVVKAVSPAVVTIVAEGVTATDPTTGQQGTGTATGSGVIFDASGLILTNHHVVAGNPSKLTVHLKDGRSLDASIYGIDTMTDLAIVKVNQTGLPTAPIGDSSSIQVGQQAIAIGSPLGEFTDSVTSGIISAVGRSIDVEDGSRLSNLIQTDTAINPGNSGGPLLDTGGRVIGINTAVAGGAQGIGFAIPIDIAKPILAQASAGQQLARAWLGIRFETIDPTLKSEANLPVDNGAWIPSSAALRQGTGNANPAPSQDPNAQGTDPFGGQDPFGFGQDPFGQGQTGGSAAPQPAIVAGSPAETAGLAEGDIITAINGTTLTLTNPLDMVVGQLAPGQTVSLAVLRNGQTITVQVTLGTRPASV